MPPANQPFMNPTSSLSGSHLRTYNTIFQHPVSHNLEWRAVRALLENIGEVVEESNGSLRATRNGHSIVLHPPGTRMSPKSRRCLACAISSSARGTLRGGRRQGGALAPRHRPPRGPHIPVADGWGDSPAGSAARAGSLFRHAHNSKDFARGREKPDPNSFFEPVATALKDARQIVVFGSGKGTGSEMEQFLSWVKDHHADLSARIIGSVVVDEHHLTRGQLLAKAREFCAAPRTAPADAR